MSDNELFYSDEALSIKSFFYNRKFMVYVEGDEDIPFWSELFEQITKEFEIEQTGGIGNLKNYMDKIMDGNKSFIVACDKDHSIYNENNKYNNCLIVHTYGYSIENSMYCPKNINYAIRRLAKTAKDYSESINTWYEDFLNKGSKLLPYDVINHVNGIGVACFGDNCCRFLDDRNKHILDDEKIATYISNIQKHFEESELEKVIDKINVDIREMRFKIKGHFLTHGVSAFVKKLVVNENKANPNLSNEAIYSLMVNCINSCNPRCNDKRHLLNTVNVAIQNVN